MNFFIPHAENNEQENKVLNALIENIEQKKNADIDSERIYKLKFKHDGEKFEATVGENGPYEDEIVTAILYDKNYEVYFIFTYNRGTIRGEPILVGKNDVLRKILFDDST
jgi:hypothetical protein